MRILVISTPVFRLGTSGLSGYGGLEQIAWLQARGLAEKGHEVFLVAPDGSECPGATIIPVGPERMVDEHMAWGGFPEARQGDRVVRPAHPGYWQHLHRMDVIVDHSWQKCSYLLKMEGNCKAPILSWMHAPVNTMFGSPPPVEKPCIVCISKDQAAHWEALHNVPAKVCYNGVDLDFYKPMDIPRTNRFLFLGRFSSVKGPDLCIDACVKAGVGLDLIGDTSITNEPDLLRSCQAKCDGKQIRMVGPASRSETVWWYSRAHCMLHPNQRFREPFGLAPVEAMACGLPVIAWDYGAMRETVLPGTTGWLVKSFDGLVKAIGQVDTSERTRIQCRNWAGQFSVQRMVDRVEELCFEAKDTGGW